MPNVVNLATRTPATHMLVVRHRDRPGVLAHVFNQLREAQPERAGDGEHRLRRRRGGGRAHQPRRRAAAERLRRGSKAATPTSSICKSSRSDRRISSRGISCPRRRPPAFINFSAGPAVLPSRCSKRRSAISLALPGVGMSILEISHRSKAVRRGASQGCEADMRDAGRHPRRLHGAVPAGRREPAVLDGADEPAAGRRIGRLHRHRRVVAEGGQGSQARRRREDRRDDRGRELRARAEAGRADARSDCRLRPLHDQQHDLRHRVRLRARRRRRAARRRRLVGHLQRADRRREVRR